MLFRKLLASALSLLIAFPASAAAQAVAIPAFSPVREDADSFRSSHLRYLSFPRDGTCGMLLDREDSVYVGGGDAVHDARQCFTYFQIGLRLSPDSFWVNLRPDAPDKIMDPLLAQTDVGRIMLEADVQLKKDLARLTSPQFPAGKRYWERLYAKAETIFGTSELQIPTVTRPWIVPGEIILRTTGTSAYIYKAKLSVRLEADRVQGGDTDPRMKELNLYSSGLIRELILPELIRMVNTSRHYSGLRKVYYSLILARWFRDNSLTASSAYARYIDTRLLDGLRSAATWSAGDYYARYRESFARQEYNVEVAVQRGTGEHLVRTCSSGGILLFPEGLTVNGGTGPLRSRDNETALKLDPDGTLTELRVQADGGKTTRRLSDDAGNTGLRGKLRRPLVALSIFALLFTTAPDRGVSLPSDTVAARTSVSSSAADQRLIGDALETLTSFHTRCFGSLENRSAGKFIADSLESYGYQKERMLPSAPYYMHNELANGIPLYYAAVIEGKPGRGAVILSAHFDSVFGGAIDNASGVAALLDVAREYAYSRPDRTLYVVFTNGEEAGYGSLGAKAFIRDMLIEEKRIPAECLVLDVDSVVPSKNAAGEPKLYLFPLPEQLSGTAFPVERLEDAIAPYQLEVDRETKLWEDDCDGYKYAKYMFPTLVVSASTPKSARDEKVINTAQDVYDPAYAGEVNKTAQWLKTVLVSFAGGDSGGTADPDGPAVQAAEDADFTASVVRYMEANGLSFLSNGDYGISSSGHAMVTEWLDFLKLRFPGYREYLNGFRYGNNPAVAHADTVTKMIDVGMPLDSYPVYANFIARNDYGYAYYPPEVVLTHELAHMVTTSLWGLRRSADEYNELLRYGYEGPQGINMDELVATDFAYMMLYGAVPREGTFSAQCFDMDASGEVVCSYKDVDLASTAPSREAFILSIFQKVGVDMSVPVMEEPVFPSEYVAPLPIGKLSVPDVPAAETGKDGGDVRAISARQDLMRAQLSDLPADVPVLRDGGLELFRRQWKRPFSEPMMDGGRIRQDKGGVDFRALPYEVRHSVRDEGSGIGIAAARDENMPREAARLRRLIACGIVPHAGSLRECLVSADGDGEWESCRAAIWDCIAGILRLEERKDAATNGEIMELLSWVDSPRTREEVLANIKAL